MGGGRKNERRRSGRGLSLVALGSGAAGVLVGLVGLLGWQAKEGGEVGKAAEVVAEAERAKARDAANRGARAREQAEELAGFLLEDLRRELIPLGRAGVLAAAAEKAVDYYEALPPDLAGGETEAKRARVLVTLGMARHNLGDVDGGAVALRKAVGAFEGLLETGGSGLEGAVLREKVGHALGELGIVLNGGGRHGEARDVYLEMLEFAKAWELESPGEPMAQGALATAYFGLGEAERVAGSPEAAIEQYARGAGHARVALESRPDDLLWLQVLSTCLNNTGYCQADLEDSEAAETAYLEAAEVTREMVALDPEHRKWDKELATLLNNLGILLDEKQDYGRARPLIEEALELRRGLVSWDPQNVRWKSNLANSWHNLAMLEYDLGNVDAGLEAADAGFEVLERMMVANPENVEAVEEMEWMLDVQRDELEAAGVPEAAEAMTRRVLAFVEERPDAGGAIGELLGELHEEIARLEGESGGAEGAMEARRLAAAARGRSFAAEPGDAERAFELALSYASFAVSCREAGKRRESLAAFRLAHWMMRDLVEAGFAGRDGYLDKLRRDHVGAARSAGVEVPGDVLLAAGATWRYWDQKEAPGDGWASAGFDDGGWKRGRAELGYGDGDEQTVIRYGGDADRKNLTAWFRGGFEVADAGAVVMLRFSLKRDDGAVVYLNGEEVFRSGMRQGEVTPTTVADVTTQDDEEEIFFITETAAEAAGLADGRNVVAVEVHQNEAISSDLSFDLEVAADVVEPDPAEVLDRSFLVEMLGEALPEALLELLPGGDEE